MQSGTALGLTWGGYIPAEKALQYSSVFASNLNCEERDLECLQSKSVDDIINQSDVLDIPEGLFTFAAAWMPVMDKDFTPDPFLIGNPMELIESNQFNADVEVVIGTTKDEGLQFLIGVIFDPSLYEVYDANWDVFGPMKIFNLGSPDDVSEDDEVNARKILDFYTNGDGHFSEEQFRGLVQMITDSFGLYGVHKAMKAFVSTGMTVYHYILTYEGDYSYLELYGLPHLGVCHADDLIYLFRPIFDNNWNSSEPFLFGTDKEVSSTMTSAWTNFVAFGDPTPPSEASHNSWLPVEQENFRYWNISGPFPQMEYSEVIAERMNFWFNLLG